MTITKLNDMKKYKLIKDYPFAPCKIGETISKIEKVLDNYPEFWQEVKEPLFVTDDGVEVYNPKQILFKVVNTNTSFAGWVNYIPCNTAHSSTEKIFSTMELAEQWIDQNKPVFSKKQVLDAIAKNTSGMPHITEDISFMIYRDSFVKELGL